MSSFQAGAHCETLTGKRILVVDDDESSAEALLHLLQIEGASVVQANDTQAALAALENQPFDVLVTDIAMPGLDGYQLLERVRSNPKLKDLRVIALTGAGRGANAQRSIEVGFDAHLTKPLHLDALLRTLARVLREDPPEGEPESR